jgi:hypothetical protein
MILLPDASPFVHALSLPEGPLLALYPGYFSVDGFSFFGFLDGLLTKGPL